MKIKVSQAIARLEKPPIAKGKDDKKDDKTKQIPIDRDGFLKNLKTKDANSELNLNDQITLFFIEFNETSDDKKPDFVSTQLSRILIDYSAADKNKTSIINEFLPRLVEYGNPQCVKTAFDICPAALTDPTTWAHIAAKGTPEMAAQAASRLEVYQRPLLQHDAKKEEVSVTSRIPFTKAVFDAARKNKNDSMIHHLMQEREKTKLPGMFDSAIKYRNNKHVKELVETYEFPDALFFAVNHLNPDIVKFLLTECPKAIDLRYKRDGMTVLHHLVDLEQLQKDHFKEADESEPWYVSTFAEKVIPIIMMLHRADPRLIHELDKDNRIPLVAGFQRLPHAFVLQTLIAAGSSFYPHAPIKQVAKEEKKSETTSNVMAVLETQKEEKAPPSVLDVVKEFSKHLPKEKDTLRYILALASLLSLSGNRPTHQALKPQDADSIRAQLKETLASQMTLTRLLAKKDDLAVAIATFPDLSDVLEKLWDPLSKQLHENSLLYRLIIVDIPAYRRTFHSFTPGTRDRLLSFIRSISTTKDYQQRRDDLSDEEIMSHITCRERFGNGIVGAITGSISIEGSRPSLQQSRLINDLALILFAQFENLLQPSKEHSAGAIDDMVLYLLTIALKVQSVSSVLAIWDFFKKREIETDYPCDIFKTMTDAIGRAKKDFQTPPTESGQLQQWKNKKNAADQFLNFGEKLVDEELTRRNKLFPAEEMGTLMKSFNQFADKQKSSIKKMFCREKGQPVRFDTSPTDNTFHPCIQLWRQCGLDQSPAITARIMLALVKILNSRSPQEASQAALAGCLSLSELKPKNETEKRNIILFYELLGITRDSRYQNKDLSLMDAVRRFHVQGLKNFENIAQVFAKHFETQGAEREFFDFVKKGIEEAMPQPKKAPVPTLHSATAPARDRGDSKAVNDSAVIPKKS